MKLLFDFFPIILFFITFKFYDDPKEGLLAATAVIIVATIVQVGVSWIRNRKVERLHLITLALIVTFGGATLILEDEMFIKWKPSVVNWLFGVVFLGSQVHRQEEHYPADDGSDAEPARRHLDSA